MEKNENFCCWPFHPGKTQRIYSTKRLRKAGDNLLFVNNQATDPYYNLACEEVLLKELTEDVCMLWRNHNTVVVGRNQNTYAEVNQDYAAAHGIRVVRRMSGGGAVYHDLGNINFTFIISGADSAFCDYARFTRPILDFLGSLGVDAQLEGRNDLTIGGRKCSGNAQYLYHDRLLHHGTLLYDTVPDVLAGVLRVPLDKVRSKGIASVRSRVTNIAEHLPVRLPAAAFFAQLSDYLLAHLPDCVSYSLAPHEADIRQLAKEKYGTWAWNYGYSPRYDETRTLRFDGGTVEAALRVGDGGVMEDVRFYGDFFSRRDVSELAKRLVGIHRTRYEMEQVVHTIPIDAYFTGIKLSEFFTWMGV